LVTGACFSARELYSNTEEVNLTARNPLLLNGIDDVATRPDLAERSIVLHLPSIPAERRRMEAEIWRDLYECRPQILAGLFTAASEALNRRGTTKLKKPPRMADFAHFVSSGELALKIPEGGFLRAYDEAQEAMNAVGLEGYPAMELLINVLKHENFEHRFAGTASALLDCLTKSAGENYALFKHPLWPKSAQILSNQIKRAAPLLRKRGVHYNQSRTGGERTWTIWMDEEKAREMPSPASSPSLCYQTNDDNDARDDVTQGWPYK
jgi:putative DNA primase/helicase